MRKTFRRLGIPLLQFTLALGSASSESLVKTVGPENGGFHSVQAAIDSVPPDNAQRTVIIIGPGLWFGHTVLDKPNVTLRGAGHATCLTFNLGQEMPGTDTPTLGWQGAAALLVTDAAKGAVIEDLTLENTFGKNMQAQACSATADRVVFRRCWMLGRQDTLRIDSGRMFFDKCYIVGEVDFIYGSATAFFSDCDIFCRDAGYIVAPSTPDGKTGFVFENCRIRFPNAKPSTYLGRPWHESPSATFIRCEMGAGVRPEGWAEWNVKPPAIRFAEYQCTGPGAAPEGRVTWAVSSAEKAPASFERGNVLGDWTPPNP